MKIRGVEYELSKRRALDVLALADVLERRGGAESSTTNILTMVLVIRDSLCATYKRLGWMRGWRYRKFTKANGADYLVWSLTPEEIGSAYAHVLELEGLKKKVQQLVENELAGQSAKVS